MRSLRRSLENELRSRLRMNLYKDTTEVVDFLEKALGEAELVPVTMRMTSSGPSPNGQKAVVTAVFNNARRSGLFTVDDAVAMSREVDAWVNEKYAEQAVRLRDETVLAVAGASLTKQLTQGELDHITGILRAVYPEVTRRDERCREDIRTMAEMVAWEAESVPGEELEARRRAHEQTRYRKLLRRAIAKAVEEGVPEEAMREAIEGSDRD